MVALAGLAALYTLGNSGKRALPDGSSWPFGQHYAGLEQRRVAGASTMAAPARRPPATSTRLRLGSARCGSS
jgi:hypothetical protein